jgi:hypothetical protein
MMKNQAEFAEDSRKERGRPLTGRYAHYCRDWDFLTIDETCPEWPCGCGIEEYVNKNEINPETDVFQKNELLRHKKSGKTYRFIGIMSNGKARVATESLPVKVQDINADALERAV